MPDKYPFYGHDRGLDITQPQSGKFVERPMTFAELAARDAALEISRDIYRHANYAGVCYHEIWQIISKAAARATHDDLIQFRGALVRIVLEGEGCGPDCSKEFHRMAIDSMLKIAKDALRRATDPTPAGREP